MDLNALLDKKAKKVSKKKDKSKSKLSETERIQLGLEEFAGLGTEPIALTHTHQSAAAAAETTAKPVELTKIKDEVDNKDDHIITSNSNESGNHSLSNNLTSSNDDEKNKISVTNDNECVTADISAKHEKSEKAKTYDNLTQRVDVNEDSKNSINDNNNNKQWMHSDTEKENSPEEKTLLEQNKEVQVDKLESSAHMEPSTSPMHIDHDDNLKTNVVSIVNVNTDQTEENVTINNKDVSGVNEVKKDEEQQEDEEEQDDGVVDATALDFSDVTISTSSISKKIRSWSDVKVDVLVSKLGKSASSANLNDSTKEEEQKEDKPKKFVARGKRNATGELALNFPLNKLASNAELPTLEEAIARLKNPKESNVESPSSATSPLTGKAGQDERNKSVSWADETTVTSSPNATPAPASPKYIPPSSRGNLYKPPSSPSPTSPSNLYKPSAFKSSHYGTNSLNTSASAKREGEVGSANTCTSAEKTITGSPSPSPPPPPQTSISEITEATTVNEINNEPSTKPSPVPKYVPPSSSSPTNVYRPPPFRTGAAHKSSEDLTITSANAINNDNKGNTLRESSKLVSDSKADVIQTAETSVGEEKDVVKKPAPYRPPMRNATTLPPAPSPVHSPPPPPSATTDDKATTSVNTGVSGNEVAKNVNLVPGQVKQVYRPPTHRSTTATITPYVPADRKPLDAKQPVQDNNAATDATNTTINVNKNSDNSANVEAKANVYRPPTSNTSHSSGNVYRPPAARKTFTAPAPAAHADTNKSSTLSTSQDNGDKLKEESKLEANAGGAPVAAPHDTSASNDAPKSNVYRPPTSNNAPKPNVYRPPNRR